jgi:hypothetical protein
MKPKSKQVKTQFAPDTRFEVSPAPAVPFRGRQETELDRFKIRLLRQFLKETPDPELNAPLRRAANEAAALAWMTPYPLLVLPALLEEKARTARAQTIRQARIRQRTRNLLMEVA